MGKENRLYSISLGVASLQGGLVGVATALSPATCRPFQVFSPSFFVGLELILGARFPVRYASGLSDVLLTGGFLFLTTRQLSLTRCDNQPGKRRTSKCQQKRKNSRLVNKEKP